MQSIVNWLNKLKKKKDMTTIINIEKASDKIKHQSMTKTFGKLGTEGNFHN